MLAESEPEDGTTILGRIVQCLENACDGLARDDVRIGMASYPGHGLSGKDLIRIAEEGLEKTSLEMPIFMAEILEDDEDDEDVEEEVAEPVQSEAESEEERPEEGSKGWKDRRKNSNNCNDDQ